MHVRQPWGWGLESRRDSAGLGMGMMRNLAGKDGVKGLRLVGHEKVPHGFGLRTGDCSDPADGTGEPQEASQPRTDD